MQVCCFELNKDQCRLRAYVGTPHTETMALKAGGGLVCQYRAPITEL